LDCPWGGLVTKHQNEVRDALGDLALLVYKNVGRELVACEDGDTAALIADLSTMGVGQQPQGEALAISCLGY